MVTGAMDVDETEGATELPGSEGGSVLDGILLAGEDFGEVGGVFTAATVGAGVACGDGVLELVAGVGVDVEGLSGGELPVDALGLEVDRGVLLGEDGEGLVVQGDDVEGTPASDGEGVALEEVLSTDVDEVGLDGGLEELEGVVHGGDPLFSCCPALEDNQSSGGVKWGGGESSA